MSSPSNKEIAQQFLSGLLAIGCLFGGIFLLGLIYNAVSYPWRHDKSDGVPPSPNAKMSEIIEHVTFLPSVRGACKFQPPFYIVVDDKEGKTGLETGLTSNVANLSETLQGARTVVFVRLRSWRVGNWVTTINQKVGTAATNRLKICCIDIANPSRRCVMTARSDPGKTPKDGTSEIDGKKYEGQKSSGMLLNYLLKKVMDKSR